MTQEDYYKQVSAGNFWSNNYIENESNGNKNKTLSISQENTILKRHHK